MESSDRTKHESTRSAAPVWLWRGLAGLVLAVLVGLGVWFGAPPPDTASAQQSTEQQAQDVTDQDANEDPGSDGDSADDPEASSGEPDMSETATWAEVDRLMSEQKYQAALDAVVVLRQQAESASRAASDELLRALVRETQLTVVLHGYERSVRFLRDAAESGLWPEDPDAVLIHRLFYAHTLRTYQQAYSWQIRQRERTTSLDADLDQWTLEQIAEEIHGAFSEAWSLRREWGDRSLGDLSRFLQQNTYPARIRGTLRDSISHLWIGLLEDQSLWTPRQSNEIWKLDLETLLASGGADVQDEMLQDSEVHPLRKIQIVLADLEDWHRRSDRPEAAFDARRVLISKLSGSYSDPGDQQLLRDELAAALGRLGRDYPWWSMGQADLAEMTASSDQAWAIRDGRDLAEAGRIAYPKSAGGERCAALVERWERPRVSIHAMANDGSGRRSVQVNHANTGTLYWRALPWDIEGKLRSSKDRLDVRNQDVQQLLAQKPLAEWQTDLPPTPDLRDHETYVTPPLEDYGAYVLVADSDPDFRIDHAVRGNPADGSLVYFVAHRITDLALFARQTNGTLHAEVRAADQGRPLADVEVEAWRLDWQTGHRVVASGRTNASGELSVRVPKSGQYQIVARRGDDSVHQQLWIGDHQPEGDSTQFSTLHYTDRAIYRPGQELHWKTVAYRQRDQFTHAEVLKDHEIKVQLFDANGEEVASQDVTTNEWGSASGTFQIPTGRALGSWRLSSFWNSTNIRVEEYKRPTFEVAMQKPDESLRFGRPTELTGEARYYFGAPVTDGRVEWRVTRTPILPHWWYWRMGWSPSPPQVLASGETKVESDGTFRFEFSPEADPSLAKSELGRQVAYAFTIEADVVDPGGETRSGETTLRAGFITVQASVSGSEVLQDGAEVAFDVSRTNLEGKVSPGEGRWEFVRLDPPSEPVLPSEVPVALEYGRESPGDGEEPYRTEGDRLHPRWSGGQTDVQSVLRRWDEGELVASDTVNHENQAQVPVALPGLVPGAYVFRYVTEDESAANSALDVSTRVEAEQRFVVLPRDSDRDSAEQPGTPPLPLLLHPESSSVEVGGDAEVVVHTGWTDQDVMLEIWSGDERLRREVLSGGELHRIEWPVEASHRGSLVFDASLVRDHQQIRRQATINVPWTDKKLQVELSSFRDLLRPGAAETWTVAVRDPDGKPLGARAAEVLASMYDRSLDHFATLYPPSPETSWRSWTMAPSWATSVGVPSGARQIGRQPRPRHGAPGFRDDRLILFDGYPVGGPGRRRMATMSMMKSMPSPAPPARASAPMAEAAFDDEARSMDRSAGLAATETVVALEEVGYVKKDEYSGAEEPEAPTSDTSGLRTDFSETAFWEPHLLLTDDGTASFEFEVPDAVTEWRVWLRALTSDFRAGGYETTVRTSKDLLVRPYLPRFFREGDRAELRVVVSNQGEGPLSGTLDFDVIDPGTEASRLADFGLTLEDTENVPFEIESGGQATLHFEVTAPKDPGEIAIRVLGSAMSAGDTAWSDGELRPLPVLPSRLYLSQSRFAVLDRPESRTLRFDDLMAEDDPTLDHESLVMTLDGQLLTTVLNALPYLVEYPYSCTEQSLNRFVSTGIVSEVFADHPMVAELAKGLSDERGTQNEAWTENDPNRKLLLEETPWLRQARGGQSEDDAELRKILDPEVAAQVRDEALDRVLKSQTSSGGFPWWPGGPPSPYMTLYVLDSFSRALEFGVDVPRQPVVQAWRYLESHFRQELAPRMAESAICCLPVAAYLNWMLSNFPDESWTGNYFTEADRQRLLDYGFKHWRNLAPRIKGYLALTLQREGRSDDASLVWDSVMDSAKADEDLGTYWAPEKMAWLWYNDTIETHAFALRVLAELDPNDERRAGLAQWLLVQKKLNHWKSTRATAEVLYSLVHYLKSQDLIGIREAATVRVGNIERDFVFAGPDARASDRRQQWVIEGDDVKPSMGEIKVSKETKGFLIASATWHFATDQLPTEAEGDLFHVERKYFRRVLVDDEWTLEPLAEGAQIAVGDQLEVQLDIRAKHAAEYVHLRDPRGAGFEPEDTTSGYRWDSIGHYREIRDSATNFFFEWLPAGQYVLQYRVRAATAGTFRVGPAQLQSMYAPEFVAYSTGEVLGVEAE